MSLQNILGDTEVCRQMESLINSRRLPHAVVIESKDTSLAKETALELAKSCVCSSEAIRPCGECNHCKKAAEGIHPDIYTVKILDKKQAVGVGEIRMMISDCFVKPNEAACKVYLIFDKMTVEAQNALLKILEEPPQNVQFIIVTESSTILLQTVRSRSTVFKLSESGSTQSSVKDEKADEIAVEIASAIPQNVELPLLIATGKLINDKQLTQKVLERLSSYLSLALEEKYFKSGTYPLYISELSRSLRKRSLIKLLDTISKAQTMLSQNCNMNLLVTWLCANIRQSRHIR